MKATSGSPRTYEFLRLRIGGWGLVTASGVVASAGTILGFLGGLWWLLDLFVHFRVQYFLGLTAAGLILLVPRRYVESAIFGVCAVVNACVVAPLYFAGAPQPAAVSPPYRAMLVNVNTEFGKPEKVARVIEEYDPDVLVLEEVTEAWLLKLEAALKRYAFSKAMPRTDNFGIAVYSKLPFLRSEIRRLGDADVPLVIAEVGSPRGPFTVVAAHFLPPAGGEYTRWRNDQLAQLPAMVKEARSPVLLLGDLNATPWCSEFKSLLAESGMRDSSQGRGVQATWPAWNPLLLIPIDHCLHAAGIWIAKKEIGPNVGSDHYPVVVAFALGLAAQRSGEPSAQAGPDNQGEGHITLLVTVEKVEASPVPESTQNWIVQGRVDRVLSGGFSGKTFSFRVHSPAESGLEVGKQYRVEAKRTKDGYAVVDQYQWMK